MKIAVYGDSYADNNFPQDRIDYKNWMDLLIKDGHQVTSWGKSASSLSYSYDIFRKNYKNFDKNIFLVTNSDRMIVKGFGEDSPLYHFNSISLLDTVKDMIKKSPRSNKLHLSNIVKAIELYFQYIQNDTVDNNNHLAMIDSIRSLDPSCILVPVFDRSFNDQRIGLAHLSWQDYDYYGKSDQALDIQHQRIKVGKIVLTDQRRCHLTIENNLVFYKKIIKAIKNNDTIIFFDTKEYIAPSMPFEFYFQWKKFY